MADIRNDQYLHRPGAGRGAITPADPLEVTLYGPNGESISTTNRLPVEATLTGSIVEELNGGQAVRIKQAALAYSSFDFNNTPLVTVTAGAELVETAWRSVNGFGTLRYLFKRRPGEQNHPARLLVYWTSTNVFPASTDFQAVEELFNDTLSTVAGTTSTKSQWMRFGIRNDDTVDHQYHCHGMMTAG